MTKLAASKLWQHHTQYTDSLTVRIVHISISAHDLIISRLDSNNRNTFIVTRKHCQEPSPINCGFVFRSARASHINGLRDSRLDSPSFIPTMEPLTRAAGPSPIPAIIYFKFPELRRWRPCVGDYGGRTTGIYPMWDSNRRGERSEVVYIEDHCSKR
ncbi:uncharacterized protein EI97DRAFT_233647 [Westerdykella ornata]|uniref:Uncharacterized protein n=1 Tax=Westerdykella ornata TaxID=318751 RepID=A0A6A6J982_WESOR|nr:uncharacterized protein EI97DRAFT_233647 [Westerdykella ornata]KAF2272196.1 hypothetical protein EI97DRAFT_233647 [Westerdykella ornata]